MRFFNTDKKNRNLISILGKAKVSFDYDHTGVRTRLMSNIEEQQMSLAEQKIRDLTRKSFLRRHRYMTASLAALVLVAGVGATFAEADVSKPGDKLHNIDVLQEKLLLKLPLPETQKARIQTRIVEERNLELEYLKQVDKYGVKAKAVQESADSLNQAMESIRSAQEKMTSKGKTQQAEKLNTVLTKLQTLADQQEKSIQSLRDSENNSEIKKQLETQLETIKKNRR